MAPPSLTNENQLLATNIYVNSSVSGVHKYPHYICYGILLRGASGMANMSSVQKGVFKEVEQVC